MNSPRLEGTWSRTIGRAGSAGAPRFAVLIWASRASPALRLIGCGGAKKDAPTGGDAERLQSAAKVGAQGSVRIQGALTTVSLSMA